jgi:hypothetical protein
MAAMRQQDDQISAAPPIEAKARNSAEQYGLGSAGG